MAGHAAGVFAVRRDKMPALERLHEADPPVMYEARHPLTLLNRTPVDLLTVDQGCLTRVPHGYEIKEGASWI
jgi:hypothetical protein